MKFIEMTGKTLAQIVHEDEMPPDNLQASGVHDETIVRINEQGDIELRRPEGWDIIGGLLGDFQQRIKKQTGMDWA